MQRHVRSLIEVFAADAAYEITPFAATTVVSDEPMARKVARTLAKWCAFPVVLRGQDVVHINASIDTKSILRDLGFVTIAALWQRPVILQFHGGSIARIPWAANKLTHWLLTRVLAMPRVILFLSAQQRESMVEMFDIRTAKLVRNFVDAQVLVPAYDVDSGRTRAVFLGRLVDSKGVRVLMDAVRDFDPERWNISIAGTGELETAVRAAATTPGSCIRYAGFVEGDDKERLLRDSDILVLPSSHDEGLPYVLLEGAAHGCALIVTDRGASALVCKEGRNGTVIPEKDVPALRRALCEMAEDRYRLVSMKRESRAIVEDEFSYARMRSTFGDLYAEAARRESPGA